MAESGLLPPDPSEPCDGSRAQGKQSKQGSGDGPSEPPKNCPRFIPQGKAHFWLAFTMVLESTNLISGMLYCLEGYQRAAVADLHVECGSATLIPVLPEQCPDSLSHLPACDLGMANLALCEADPEDRSTMCPVSVEIDNCGKFDVYQVVVEPACAEIGCEILTKALWAFAFTSFVATTSVTSLYHTRKAWRELNGRAGTRALLVTVQVVPVLLYFTGMGFGLETASVKSVILLVVVAPIFPFSVWLVSLLLGHARSKQKSQAAMELPIFSVLLAYRLGPTHADKFIGARKPLGILLRMVEDVPEAVLGGVWPNFVSGSRDLA